MNRSPGVRPLLLLSTTLLLAPAAWAQIEPKPFSLLLHVKAGKDTPLKKKGEFRKSCIDAMGIGSPSSQEIPKKKATAYISCEQAKANPKATEKIKARDCVAPLIAGNKDKDSPIFFVTLEFLNSKPHQASLVNIGKADSAAEPDTVSPSPEVPPAEQVRAVCQELRRKIDARLNPPTEVGESKPSSQGMPEDKVADNSSKPQDKPPPDADSSSKPQDKTSPGGDTQQGPAITDQKPPMPPSTSGKQDENPSPSDNNTAVSTKGPESTSSWKKPVAYGLWTVGALAYGGAIWMTLQAGSATEDLNALYKSGTPSYTRTGEIQELKDKRKSRSTLALIGGAVGTGAAAVGTYLFLSAPAESSKPGSVSVFVGPGGAELRVMLP